MLSAPPPPFSVSVPPLPFSTLAAALPVMLSLPEPPLTFSTSVRTLSDSPASLATSSIVTTTAAVRPL